MSTESKECRYKVQGTSPEDPDVSLWYMKSGGICQSKSADETGSADAAAYLIYVQHSHNQHTSTIVAHTFSLLPIRAYACRSSADIVALRAQLELLANSLACSDRAYRRTELAREPIAPSGRDMTHSLFSNLPRRNVHLAQLTMLLADPPAPG